MPASGCFCKDRQVLRDGALPRYFGTESLRLFFELTDLTAQGRLGDMKPQYRNTRATPLI